MNGTRSPLQWRVLIGGIAGLVGVGVIGAALAFPAVTEPEALPVAASSTASSMSPDRTPSVRPTTSPSAPQSVDATPRTVPTSPPSPSPSPSAAPAPVGLPESVPVRVRIPSIAVDAGTVRLGLDGNELETPADPDEVGWFTGAHTPGAPGRAVLAGHLTWNGRHTVFARLPELAAGSVVEVDREDGTTAKFEVTKVSTFAKDVFPTAEVYASTDEPSLVLITCGGEYSQSEHYYDSNVIAFASALD